MPSTIDEFARTTPNKPAVIMADDGTVVTFAELTERSIRAAHLFARLGLRPGDGIAVLMDNNPRYFDACWAAQRSGLYYTTVNWHLKPEEARYVLEDCGAKVLITTPRLARTAAEIADGLPLAARLVAGDTQGELPAGFQSLDAATAGMPTTAPPGELEGAPMIYSSGTTGRPKGVQYPLSNEPYGTGTAADHVVGTRYSFGADAVYLSPAPLYHAAPIMWTMIAQRQGGTAVVLRSFDAELALRTIEHYGVTLAQFVPTMFIRMLRLPPEVRQRYDLSSLTMAVHAAAPCPVWAKEQMLQWWGPTIWEYLGASEGGYVGIGPHEWLDHKGSVGRPEAMPVHVLDDDGNELGPGEIGGVYFEGGPRTRYHNDETKTDAAYSPQGWRTVGDVGYLDADGYLYLTDRKANVINSGGVKIYPQAVEDVLSGHPAVFDVAVIGVPNEEFGEEVKAVVQPAGGATPGPELATELIAYCREHLGHYQCPTTVDFDAELPRLPSGKLLKRLIKDRYWQDRMSRVI